MFAQGAAETPQDAAYPPMPFNVRGGAPETLSGPHAPRDSRFRRYAGRAR
ncbi:hypothetical protein ACFLIM_36610 [Nonomuraea sp. M3C6]|uniref:Uncharacterized protein n=1 Tax=Nonomuraea marmarensis TaxID=3351344 RepID=A0ABW7AR38_9ACTN